MNSIQIYYKMYTISMNSKNGKTSDHILLYHILVSTTSEDI